MLDCASGRANAKARIPCKGVACRPPHCKLDARHKYKYYSFPKWQPPRKSRVLRFFPIRCQRLSVMCCEFCPNWPRLDEPLDLDMVCLLKLLLWVQNHRRLAKRRRTLLERNAPRNNQPETHRNRWSEGRSAGRSSFFACLPSIVLPCLKKLIVALPEVTVDSSCRSVLRRNPKAEYIYRQLAQYRFAILDNRASLCHSSGIAKVCL